MALILSPGLPNQPETRSRPDLFPLYSQLESVFASTGTRLDLLTAIVETDPKLAQRTPPEDIAAGAQAADGLNAMIVGLVADLGLLEDGAIDAAEVEAINAEIQLNETLYAEFLRLHGDDENGVETGFHRVQGDGAGTVMFGVNAVDALADAIYHIGFDIDPATGRFVNEDGAQNIAVARMAEVLTYFLGDLSTTGSGLDRIVDAALSDDGLARLTAPGDILAGAAAADAMNAILLAAIEATGAGADARITAAEAAAVTAHIRADPALLAEWTRLHGDDEAGVETGFHLIQGDGGTAQLGGLRLIDVVADGLYHMGFEIDPATERYLNEDGDLNASTGQVATWLNALLYGALSIEGTSKADALQGSAEAEAEAFHGAQGDDRIEADRGDDTLDGGAGDDALFGDAGADVLRGGPGRDLLDAGVDDAADRIVFAPEDLAAARPLDILRNFDAGGEDAIDLTAFGGLEVVEDGFTGLGQVWIRGETILLNIAEGGVFGPADAAIRVLGAEGLGAEDLLL